MTREQFFRFAIWAMDRNAIRLQDIMMRWEVSEKTARRYRSDWEAALGLEEQTHPVMFLAAERCNVSEIALGLDMAPRVVQNIINMARARAAKCHE